MLDGARWSVAFGRLVSRGSRQGSDHDVCAALGNWEFVVGRQLCSAAVVQTWSQARNSSGVEVECNR